MVDLTKGPHIMGILNVTPDSFSDGGRFNSVEAAVVQGLKMADDGASIIDIGGESTKPGADPVSIQEEMDRVLPVIEALKKHNLFISIDSRNAKVMEEAVKAGASMINDVSAMTHDDDTLDLIGKLGVPVCLMHMKGQPKNMQDNPDYDDVVTEVMTFLVERVTLCEKMGLGRDKIVIDPGIGFGKGLQHNIELMQSVSELHKLGVSILVGLSRKSFLNGICTSYRHELPVSERLPGSLAANLWCLKQGVQIFRVHDVAETRQSFAVWDALQKK